MFGFGKKKEDPNRKALRQEFESVTSALRTADATAQIAVGHAINMANSLFHKSFSGVNGFQDLPKSERISYINKLTDMESPLKSKGDMPASLGFGLFKMWAGAAAELDAELMNQFSRELAYFSKKGDISP